MCDKVIGVDLGLEHDDLDALHDEADGDNGNCQERVHHPATLVKIVEQCGPKEARLQDHKLLPPG